MDYAVDKRDMRSDIQKFNAMLKEGVALGKGYRIESSGNIWICGMGGSGMPGLIASSLSPRVRMVRDYHIPHLKKEDAVILVSYSGNTEETISCHRDAIRVGAETIIISSGGNIVKNKSRDTKVIELPKGFQPRVAMPYLVFPVLQILFENKIIDEDLGSITLDLKALEDNGKAMAEQIGSKTVLIYGSSDFYPAAYRWKTQINENAKEHAFCHVFSELNHNELEAYTNNTNFHVVFIHHERDFSRVRKRIDLTKKAVKDSGSTVSHLKVKGNFLTALFQTILLGDWVSYYKALNKEIDPTPVNTIEQFKKEMGPFI